jgi:hypothetical protein
MTQKDASETLVVEATVDRCNKVRQQLLKEFEYLWFYVYSKNGKFGTLTAANAFSGKLESAIAAKVIFRGKELLDEFKSK